MSGAQLQDFFCYILCHIQISKKILGLIFLGNFDLFYISIEKLWNDFREIKMPTNLLAFRLWGSNFLVKISYENI